MAPHNCLMQLPCLRCADTAGVFWGGCFSCCSSRLTLFDTPPHPQPPPPPALPLCLYFTADRGSARAPPARVIYDRQLLGKSPWPGTAGCQMWSPWKQKLISLSAELGPRVPGTGKGGGERRGAVGQRLSGISEGKKCKWIEGKQMRLML